MYSSDGLPIIGNPIHELGRIRDYRFMIWRVNSVHIRNIKATTFYPAVFAYIFKVDSFQNTKPTKFLKYIVSS